MEAMQALSFVAALGAGLNAGFFFAFSILVMPALGKQPPANGIAAMQTINVVVLNPWFFGVFFGTALVSLLLTVMAIVNGTDATIPALAGAAIYLIGTIFVTMAFNVPLNNALAAAAPQSAEGQALWRRYLVTWTNWNHVRTIAPLAACACFMQAYSAG